MVPIQELHNTCSKKTTPMIYTIIITIFTFPPQVHPPPCWVLWRLIRESTKKHCNSSNVCTNVRVKPWVRSSSQWHPMLRFIKREELWAERPEWMKSSMGAMLSSWSPGPRWRMLPLMPSFEGILYSYKSNKYKWQEISKINIWLVLYGCVLDGHSFRLEYSVRSQWNLY